MPRVAEARRRGRSLRRIGSALLTILFLLGVLTALVDAVVLPLADVTARVDGDRLVLGDGAQATGVPGLGALVALMRSAWGGLAVLVLALAAAGLWCWPDLAGERTATWRVTVRRHVLAMTVVPVLVVVAAGWFLGSATLDDLRRARDTEDVVAAMPALLTATEAIQAEAGPVTDEAARAAAVTATDDALRTLSETLAGSAADAAGTATRAVAGAEQQVAAARTATDPAVARQEWESAARSLDDLAEGWAAEVRDPAVASALRAAVATDRLAGTIAGEHRRVTELVTALAQLPVVAPVPEDEDTDSRSGTDRDEDEAEPVVVPQVDAGLVRQAALAVAGVQAQRERAATALAVAGDALSLPAEDQVLADARAVIAAAEPTLIAEPARGGWAERAAAETAQLRDLAAAELDLAADDAATAEAEARTATLGVLAVGSLLVVLVLLVAVAVMRRLGTRRTVPVTPVPAAQPPAAAPAPQPDSPRPARPAPPTATPDPASSPTGLPMLIHVAQREQSLAARQLVVLDELEQSEVDPEVLSRLFELDNLATRSRRGAESVLVLAGSQTGRREREETALSDVVRIAAAQIEQYDRVRLELTDDPELVGHAVVPLAHLLAELLENATVHSDPLLPVRVGATLGPEGVELTVTDEGLGMDADERAAAAALVAGELPPEGRRLGLVVVGRLARSLGVRVEFPETGSGTVVRLRLPVSVVAAGSRPEGAGAGSGGAGPDGGVASGGEVRPDGWGPSGAEQAAAWGVAEPGATAVRAGLDGRVTTGRTGGVGGTVVGHEAQATSVATGDAQAEGSATASGAGTAATGASGNGAETQGSAGLGYGADALGTASVDRGGDVPATGGSGHISDTVTGGNSGTSAGSAASGSWGAPAGIAPNGFLGAANASLDTSADTATNQGASLRADTTSEVSSERRPHPATAAPERDAMPTPERGQRVVPAPGEVRVWDTRIRTIEQPAPIPAPVTPPSEDLTVWDTRPRQDRDPEPAAAPPVPESPPEVPAPRPELAVWDTRGREPIDSANGAGTGSGVMDLLSTPGTTSVGDTGVWAPAEVLDEATELPRRQVGTDGDQPYRPEVAAPAAVDALAVRGGAWSSRPRDPEGLRARFQRFRSGVRDGHDATGDPVATPAGGAGSGPAEHAKGGDGTPGEPAGGRSAGSLPGSVAAPGGEPPNPDGESAAMGGAVPTTAGVPSDHDALGGPPSAGTAVQDPSGGRASTDTAVQDPSGGRPSVGTAVQDLSGGRASTEAAEQDRSGGRPFAARTEQDPPGERPSAGTAEQDVPGVPPPAATADQATPAEHSGSAGESDQ